MLIGHRTAASLAALVTCAGLLGAATAQAQAASTSVQAARTAQAAPQHPGRHLEAALHGAAGHRSARGHADYESHWRRHLDVSVWNTRLAGRSLVVYVHGTRVGTMRIWRGGSGHFERSHGVPRCSPGTVISIRTRSGGLVASGTFHRDHMMW